jgi:hypothetical protein
MTDDDAPNEGAELPQRAWGGPQPGGGVPVPAEFEQLTGLGPAEAVIEREGFQLFPSFGPPVPRVLVRYRDGFAFRTKTKDVHVWRWEEIAVIQSNVWVRGSGRYDATAVHEYTLTKRTGEKVILDDSLKTSGGIGHVKKAVLELLEPRFAERYRGDEAMTFGPVTVHRKNGLEADGKHYAWAAIRNIEVEYGRFVITGTDGKRQEVRASKIPNIELLCKLIGLNLNSAKLAYA